MHDAHPVRSEHVVLLQRMGEQLLPDQLVQRLLQDLGKRQGRLDRPVGCAPGCAVALPPDLVLRRLLGPRPVGLCVLPLEQHELDEAVLRAVQERCVEARAVGAAHALPGGHLVEVVRRSDVLERQEAAGLDLEDVPRAETVGEGKQQTLRVVHHLPESVHALDLRGQQVIAGSTADADMPGDAQLREQLQRRLSHLGEQGQGGVLSREAEVARRAPAGAGLVDVGGGEPCLGGQGGGEALPGRGLGALLFGVGRHHC